jgi:hypothetical protein
MIVIREITRTFEGEPTSTVLEVYVYDVPTMHTAPCQTGGWQRHVRLGGACLRFYLGAPMSVDSLNLASSKGG